MVLMVREAVEIQLHLSNLNRGVNYSWYLVSGILQSRLLLCFKLNSIWYVGGGDRERERK
jgi:hypothetical protein